jgi:hypothetical protein
MPGPPGNGDPALPHGVAAQQEDGIVCFDWQPRHQNRNPVVHEIKSEFIFFQTSIDCGCTPTSLYAAREYGAQWWGRIVASCAADLDIRSNTICIKDSVILAQGYWELCCWRKMEMRVRCVLEMTVETLYNVELNENGPAGFLCGNLPSQRNQQW